MRQALISVSDKRGVAEFARGLVELGFTILSTGGTARFLREQGLTVTPVSEATGFPEILDGRVKTLHPRIHGGILAERTAEHLRQLAEHQITPIEIVAVNLYPFQATVAREGVGFAEAIENIDVGGPTMVRAAAKNHQYVTVVVNPERYQEVLAQLMERRTVSAQLRLALAVEAFAHTAAYDRAIHHYLSRQAGTELFPGELVLAADKLLDLRYGENPHQRAAFYRSAGAAEGSLAAARQLQGKELSYNNILDLDAAWNLVNEFAGAAAVIIKHTNPCGVAAAASLAEAYRLALAADPLSAYGGIVALNGTVEEKTAALLTETFLEAVIAPGYTQEAKEILAQKVNLRVLAAGSPAPAKAEMTVRSVSGGLLLQDRDQGTEGEIKVVTSVAPSPEQLRDLQFAWQVVKHVKSNAIVVAKDGVTLGIGAGQMNRVGAARLALEQAGTAVRGAVLASDAFFPFRDTVDLAAGYGVAAIIQPGGSKRDAESEAACAEHGIAMVYTAVRHFRH